MFVYLFVWETLGIPETPEGDQQEHHRETNERKNALVHMSLIETPEGDQRHHSRIKETN